VEDKSSGKIKEYIKELDLYEENKTLTMQLHNATMQLHSASAQRDQLLQEKERLTKENNGLKQKVKELTDQLGKNVGQKLKQIETLMKQTETYRKQIETCQQQLTEEKEDHKHDLKEYWKVVYYELIDGRILQNIKKIMHEEEYKKIKENEWLNSNKIIELINDISHAMYDNGGFKYLQEEKITKEQWQKLKEVKKSEKQ